MMLFSFADKRPLNVSGIVTVYPGAINTIKRFVHIGKRFVHMTTKKGDVV